MYHGHRLVIPLLGNRVSQLKRLPPGLQRQDNPLLRSLHVRLVESWPAAVFRQRAQLARSFPPAHVWLTNERRGTNGMAVATPWGGDSLHNGCRRRADRASLPAADAVTAGLASAWLWRAICCAVALVPPRTSYRVGDLAVGLGPLLVAASVAGIFTVAPPRFAAAARRPGCVAVHRHPFQGALCRLVPDLAGRAVLLPAVRRQHRCHGDPADFAGVLRSRTGLPGRVWLVLLAPGPRHPARGFARSPGPLRAACATGGGLERHAAAR